jgi:hypothetical protein
MAEFTTWAESGIQVASHQSATATQIGAIKRQMHPAVGELLNERNSGNPQAATHITTFVVGTSSARQLLG